MLIPILPEWAALPATLKKEHFLIGVMEKPLERSMMVI
jgi:hypothetical protein